MITGARPNLADIEDAWQRVGSEPGIASEIVEPEVAFDALAEREVAVGAYHHGLLIQEAALQFRLNSAMAGLFKPK